MESCPTTTRPPLAFWLGKDRRNLLLHLLSTDFAGGIAAAVDLHWSFPLIKG